MPAYSLYGLSAVTEFPIEQLPETTGDPDVTIGTGSIPARARSKRVLRSNGTVTIAHDDGAISIERGERITIDAPEGFSTEHLGRIAVSQPLAILLHQRGQFVLHASSVAVDGRAIAFVGPKGRGKSTAALAMLSHGHKLLADDSTAVETDGSAPTVRPGHPIVRIRRPVPDEVEAYVQLQDPLPDAEKVDALARAGVPKAPLPLEQIYLLDGSNAGPSSPRTLTLELVANNQFARLGDDVLSGADSAELLRAACSLAERVTIKRLPAPDITDLDGFADRVEGDLSDAG